MTRVMIEYSGLGVLALVGTSFLLPSLLVERQHLRDDARRQVVADARQQIEDFYNRNNRYPLQYETPPTITYIATEQTSTEALGYYVETNLESDPGGDGGFDEDEKRKYYYLILRQGNDIVYRVCGGTETSCQR